MKSNNDKKSKKIKVTLAQRKKYGICEHDHVNYKTLEKLNRELFKRLKSKTEDFAKLHAHTLELQETNNQFADYNERLVKDNFALTRAYDGLSQMGKMAQDLGINIEEHRWRLPENTKNHDYQFKHEAKLMESGKVKNVFKFKMPDSERKKFNDALIKQKNKKENNNE